MAELYGCETNTVNEGLQAERLVRLEEVTLHAFWEAVDVGSLSYKREQDNPVRDNDSNRA